jgi:hypothetical protein
MKKVIIVFAFLAFAISANAQWQPDVRLTNAPGDSYTSYSNTWCVAASGNTVHAVWYDHRDGNAEIYYKLSTDAGIIWGADIRLTNYPGFSIAPSIAVSGTFVHVVWFDERDGTNEIYYKRSTDAGLTWGPDCRLTNNPYGSGSYHPSIAVSDSNVYVGWHGSRDGNQEIYCKSSTNAGATWGVDTRLTNNSAPSSWHSITASGMNVHSTWIDERDGNLEIYYNRSTNGGTTWGANTRLTNNTALSHIPSIAVSGSIVHIVWMDNRIGNDEIYYKRSTDNGATWGADTRLTNTPESSNFQSIAVSGSLVFVVWPDNSYGHGLEVYEKHSTDEGTTWSGDTRVTFNVGNSEYPSATISGSNVHIIWRDNRDGNYEIYYKRNLLVPSAPVLFNPANNSTGQPVNLNLVWNKPLYSTRYRVLIATDSLFANIIVNDSLLTDSVKGISNLIPLTYYYWKVSAGNGNPAGWSSYSTVYKFKTISMPSQVALNLPANNSVNQPVNITFKWYKAFDQTVKTKAISKYWLEYSTDSTFVNSVVKDSTLTDSLKSVSGLNTAAKYFWRVKAKNIAGWGNFSSVWNFTTVPPIPFAPVLVSPINGATNLSPNILLDWNTVQYSAGYRVQIANDSLFSGIVYDTNSVVPDSLRVRSGLLLSNSKYYWRINATNVSGTGQWSTVWNFRINPTGINQIGSEIPTAFSLDQNYPNPFNPATKIRFAIPAVDSRVHGNDRVLLKVYDIMGREVQTLVNELLQPGTYETTFDGANLTSGIYFYRLQTEDYTETKRMLMIK